MADTNYERQARYRKKHPDRARASRLKYEAANQDKVRAKSKAYRLKNAAKIQKKREGNREAARAYGRKHYAANKARKAAQYRERAYGVTPEMFAAMLSAQNGLCEGCNKPMESPHVDHCHKSGKVRGLVCRECNVVMGYVSDNPLTLRQLASYLEGR